MPRLEDFSCFSCLASSLRSCGISAFRRPVHPAGWSRCPYAVQIGRIFLFSLYLAPDGAG